MWTIISNFAFAPKAIRMIDLERLYSQHNQSLLDLATRYVGDSDTARDIVHDAWIIILSGIDKVEKPDKAVSWMRGIVRNLSLKHLRFQKRHKTLTLNREAESVLDDDFDRTPISYEALMALVNDLPEKYGSVFHLAVLQGKSHEEIGRMLGIAPHSSSSNLARAKKILRERIGKYLLLGLGLLFSVTPVKEFLPSKNDYNEPDNPTSPSVSVDAAPSATLMTQGRAKRTEHVAPGANDLMHSVRNVGPMLKRPDQIHPQAIVESRSGRDLVLTRPAHSQHSLEVTHVQLNRFDMPAGLRIGWRSGWKVLVCGVMGTPTREAAERPFTIVPDFTGGTKAIDNWIEYQSYLFSNKEQMTPAQYEKLQRFVYQNSLRDITISEKQTDFRPISVGISVEKTFSSRWSLRSGLGLTYMKSATEAGNPDASSVSGNRKVWYLGIPLGVNFQMFNASRLSLYSTAGGRLDIPIVATQTMDFSFGGKSGDRIVLSGIKQVAPGCIWSVGVGVGLQYRILSHIHLYVEPTLQYHFPNGTGVQSWYTTHPLMVEVPFGIRLSW